MKTKKTKSRSAAIAAVAALGLIAAVLAITGDGSALSPNEPAKSDVPAGSWPHETGASAGTSETFVDMHEDGSYYDPSLGRRVSRTPFWPHETGAWPARPRRSWTCTRTVPTTTRRSGDACPARRARRSESARQPASAPAPSSRAARRPRASRPPRRGARAPSSSRVEPLGVDRRPARARDLRVRRRRDLLVRPPELLVQLLARPHADELDRDVALGLPAREPDHVARQVEDPDRVAHVEDEDLAAAADRAGLHDERRGLRDRHEVARHLGVRDRDRAAAARSGAGRS